MVNPLHAGYTKKMPFNHKKFIAAGVVLVMFGAIMPFLMVLKMVESTFFLNFLAYGSSIVGLILGIIGAASFGSRNN